MWEKELSWHVSGDGTIEFATTGLDVLPILFIEGGSASKTDGCLLPRFRSLGLEELQTGDIPSLFHPPSMR